MSTGAAQRIRAQGGFEMRTLLANGEQLLVSIVLPLGALLGLALTHLLDLGPGQRIDRATPGVLALAIVSSAFTAQAIATGYDRRYAVLRLLGTTPLGRGGLLAGKAVATVGIVAVQWVVIGAVASALGWRPSAGGVLLAIPIAVVGTWAFVALALLLAGSLRAEGVLALANLVWVVLVAIGGLIVPADRLPGALGAVISWSPSSALADALRAAQIDGTLALDRVALLVGWGLIASLVASRTFRWSD